MLLKYEHFNLLLLYFIFNLKKYDDDNEVLIMLGKKTEIFGKKVFKYFLKLYEQID